MPSITITGGGLIGLFCADILSSKHNVTIIEINAEIGFPANFPGIISQSNNISKLLDSAELSNLYIFDTGNQINFRTEWFVKLLSHKLAKSKVDIIHRTRIESILLEKNQLNLQLKGSESNFKTLETDKLIDFSETLLPGPKGQIHTIEGNLDQIIKPDIPTKQFFVGTCLRNDLINLNKSKIIIERSDGLAEVWYEVNEKETPKQGWIESKILNAYYNSKIMTVDDYYKKAQDIINTMVIQ
ncbi:hypothetical protein OAE50_01580 [Candidatus Poseidoniaceae archaeon]|nr:hypothetical protein [Candidatus Poseidoniaceae archaeon]